MIRPQCYHGVQCSTRNVKKEGVNHGRWFYACSKGKDDGCGYFELRDTIGGEDPFEPFSTVYFSNPPSYGYTIKETGRSLKVVMKIVNRLTKSTCQSLKTKKIREA